MNSNLLKCLGAARCKALQKKSGGLLLALLLVSNSLLLPGCGGGSSSTAATENSLPSPVAKAIDGNVLIPDAKGQEPVPPSGLELLPQISLSQRQLADPNVLLNLSATVTAAAGASIVKTLWTQVTGPEVNIPSPLQLNNVVLLPDVNIATQLEFRLTAQDDQGRINSATVVVLVRPVPTFIKVIGGVFNEADKKAVFTLSLNAPSSSPVTLSYITLDGTAESGIDYVFASGDVVLAPGQSSVEVTVPLIDDTIAEEDETFFLQVMAVNGEATHANRGTAIIHNGQEPQLQQTIQFSNQGPVSIYIDQQYTNPLYFPAGEPGTGDILYSSSNPSVATINAQGLIVPHGLGGTEITVTKLADANYLAARATFALQVLSRGSAPTVELEEQDGFSVQVGEDVEIQGFADDQEDGVLPTSQQIADHLATGQPIASVQWESDLDGPFLTGSTFNTKYLQQGTHRLTYTVTDSDDNTRSASIRVFVGNVAVLGYAYASAMQCTNLSSANCAYPTNLNDTDLNSDIFIQYNPGSEYTESAASLLLNWETPVTINTVDLYMYKDHVMQDYDIGYLDFNNQWTLLLSVTGNTDAHRSHPIPVTSVYRLGVMVKKAAPASEGIIQVNEVVVYGAVATSSAPNLPEPGPSSSVSSSAVSSSALASSSAVNQSASGTSSSASSVSAVAVSSVSASAIASSKAGSSAVKFSSAVSSQKSSAPPQKSSSSSSKPTIIKSSSSKDFILL